MICGAETAHSVEVPESADLPRSTRIVGRQITINPVAFLHESSLALFGAWVVIGRRAFHYSHNAGFCPNIVPAWRAVVVGGRRHTFSCRSFSFGQSERWICPIFRIASQETIRAIEISPLLVGYRGPGLLALGVAIEL